MDYRCRSRRISTNPAGTATIADVSPTNLTGKCTQASARARSPFASAASFPPAHRARRETEPIILFCNTKVALAFNEVVFIATIDGEILSFARLTV